MSQVKTQTQAARWWPLAAGLALFCSVWGLIMWLAWSRAGGHFAYALDDAYIHMSMAKNFALHGVWGATPFEFSGSSSSPIWTLLLAAAFKIFGVREGVPLVFTTATSIALLVLADTIFNRFRLPAVLRFLGLCWIILASPLVALIFGGMEHPLQLAIDLALVSLATVMLVSDSWSWKREGVGILCLSLLATAVRYEGAALVLVVAVFFVFRRRWKVAAAILLAGAVPPLAYGLASLAHGGFFFPNSVLVKAVSQSNAGQLIGDSAGFLALQWAKVVSAAAVYLLFFASSALALIEVVFGSRGWRIPVVFPRIVLGVTAVHLTVGDVGWFFRYEAYLVMLIGLGLLVQLWDARDWTLATRGARISAAVCMVLVLAAVLATGHRGVQAVRLTPWAMKNVYQQQYQLAHFLRSNPQYGSVAIGDLGAIAFYNDRLRIIDLEGLALMGVPREMLGRDKMTPEVIRSLVKRNEVDVAIVFPDYFDQPSEWQQVAAWTIPNWAGVAPNTTVHFYAVPPTDVSSLRGAVEEYARESLPEDVEHR